MEIENDPDISTDDMDEAMPWHILVVDDDADILKVLQRILELQYRKVHTAQSGQEALEVLANRSIDLMITDIKMPGMNGIELIGKVRELYIDLEIIVITGYGDMNVFIEAIRMGVGDFILKPIDRHQFLAAIKRSLEKRRLSEKLFEKNLQLIQSEKMATVGLLSTGIAHEINNPTTFIRSNLQLMQEFLKRMQPRLENLDDEENRVKVRKVIETEFPQMISEAVRGTDRIASIVSGMKHYAHMGDEQGNVDIREVIKHAVTLVRPKLRKNVTITENYLDISEIRGNFSKLEQVFVNLLVNAADAIDDNISRLRKEGDTTATGLIDVSATVFEGDEEEDGSKTADNLILTFYDNGAGISKNVLTKIFDPFFTTKSVGSGTGLGLYICYEIITQHGGGITVQSTPGEGTSFIIRLPVKGAANHGERRSLGDRRHKSRR